MVELTTVAPVTVWVTVDGGAVTYAVEAGAVTVAVAPVTVEDGAGYFLETMSASTEFDREAVKWRTYWEQNV